MYLCGETADGWAINDGCSSSIVLPDIANAWVIVNYNVYRYNLKSKKRFRFTINKRQLRTPVKMIVVFMIVEGLSKRKKIDVIISI